MKRLYYPLLRVGHVCNASHCAPITAIDASLLRPDDPQVTKAPEPMTMAVVPDNHMAVDFSADNSAAAEPATQNDNLLTQPTAVDHMVEHYSVRSFSDMTVLNCRIPYLFYRITFLFCDITVAFHDIANQFRHITKYLFRFNSWSRQLLPVTPHRVQ